VTEQTSVPGTAADLTPPEVAAVIFGSALPVAQAYAALLAGPGIERGLIGPGERARIWDRHLLNSAVVAELLPAKSLIVDLGSGAGLPGLVLAMLLPDAELVLVEPMERRTVFLGECAVALELANVTVRRGRAEDLAGQLKADVVVSRAVAKLDRLAGLAAGLARPGAQVLAIKGSSAAAEVQAAGPMLRQLAVTDVEILSVGEKLLPQPTTVVRFRTSAHNRRVTAGTGRRPVGRSRG
jgi:16S rRNA (guanine527-N7)-methyltransferase